MARRLTTIAKYINERVKGLSAYAERSFSSTDRPIAGTRLRHPGKGRSGYRLIVGVTALVKGRPDPHRGYGRGVLLIHDSSETYRTNAEVEEWLAAWEGAGRRMIRFCRGRYTRGSILRGKPWEPAEEGDP